MAAVRRRSAGSSGWVFAATSLFVAACVGLAAALWFYDQLSSAKVAIRATDKAIADTVGVVFREAGWELPDVTPPELGFSYDLATMQAVAAQLRIAQEYEQQIQPVLGYKGGADTIKEVIAEAPVQDVIEPTAEESEARLLHNTLEAVVIEYARQHGELTKQNTDLSAKVKSLEDQNNKLLKEGNAQASAYQARLAGLEQLYNNRVAEVTKHKTDLERINATERDAKLKAEAALVAKEQERANQVQQLKEQIGQLEKRIEDLTAPPFRAKEEEFGPDGKIVLMKPGFVVIDCGADKGIEENELFVVYSESPDGTAHRKGLLRVGQVNDITSVVLVVSQDEENPLAEKDPCVSLETWQKFGKDTGSEPVAEGSS
jgi:hypothetical protein